MSSSRVRFKRALASLNAEAVEADELVRQLRSEDIEAVLDVRPAPATTKLKELCEAAEMYYAHRPTLTDAASRGEKHGQPDREVAWATGIALRHYACVLTTGKANESAVAAAMARVGGIRHVDFDDSPTAAAAFARTVT